MLELSKILSGWQVSWVFVQNKIMVPKFSVKKNFKSKKEVVQKSLVRKIFWLKKMLVHEIFLVQIFCPKILYPKNVLDKNFFWCEIFLGRNNFGSKKWLCSKETLRQQNFESKEILNSTKIWIQKILGPKNCDSTTFLVQKNYSLQKIGFKKFGQNWVSNS